MFQLEVSVHGSLASSVQILTSPHMSLYCSCMDIPCIKKKINQHLRSYMGDDTQWCHESGTPSGASLAYHFLLAAPDDSQFSTQCVELSLGGSGLCNHWEKYLPLSASPGRCQKASRDLLLFPLTKSKAWIGGVNIIRFILKGKVINWKIILAQRWSLHSFPGWAAQHCARLSDCG